MRADVWGDGFVDDGWLEALGVTSWDQLSPDEYLRLFPGLVATNGAVPLAAVLDRVGALVEVTRLARAPGWIGQTAEPRSGRIRTEPVSDATLAALDRVVRDGRAGLLPAFSEPVAFALAFVAQVHPAYLWPEAVLSAGSLAAAGWIGVLAAGRAALMPLDIAEALTDVIAPEQPSSGRLRDGRFAVCGLADAHWSLLAQFAVRRLRGKRDTVRLNHGRTPIRFVPWSWSRPFRRPEQATHTCF